MNFIFTMHEETNCSYVTLVDWLPLNEPLEDTCYCLGDQERGAFSVDMNWKGLQYNRELDAFKSNFNDFNIHETI